MQKDDYLGDLTMDPQTCKIKMI